MQLRRAVIARPRPCINAGGYQEWLTTQRGRARTSADDYQAAREQWYDAVNRIIGHHQFTEAAGR
jgi:beta-galactosidase